MSPGIAEKTDGGHDWRQQMKYHSRRRFCHMHTHIYMHGIGRRRRRRRRRRSWWWGRRHFFVCFVRLVGPKPKPPISEIEATTILFAIDQASNKSGIINKRLLTTSYRRPSLSVGQWRCDGGELILGFFPTNSQQQQRRNEYVSFLLAAAAAASTKRPAVAVMSGGQEINDLACETFRAVYYKRLFRIHLPHSFCSE